MAVTGRVMPADEQPQQLDIPWPAIIHAVDTISSQEVKVVKGDTWSVYRIGKLIRIDIQQGE
jgi:hypothetical protein